MSLELKDNNKFDYLSTLLILHKTNNLTNTIFFDIFNYFSIVLYKEYDT